MRPQQQQKSKFSKKIIFLIFDASNFFPWKWNIASEQSLQDEVFSWCSCLITQIAKVTLEDINNTDIKIVKWKWNNSKFFTSNNEIY